MEIKSFYHHDTNSFSYVVYDDLTKDAVLFDPVLDYDQSSATISHQFAKQLIEFITEEVLTLHYIIESHVHADHLSASQYMKSSFPNAKTAISSAIGKVQNTFAKIFNLDDLATDGSQFDCLFSDGEIYDAGSLILKIIHTPGHTPACMSTLILDCLFTGDSLFIPDFGTGRCDFPDGSAKQLYNSVHEKLFTLPDPTRVFVGHDYQPGGRELRYETTILESKQDNIQLTESTSQEEFIEFRVARDKLLNTPALLLPSIQINIQAGHLPTAESNGVRYLKLPIIIND